MRKPIAALGSAVFFVVAPGTVAGLLPYWLSDGWHSHAALWYLRIPGALLILAGLVVIVNAFARFATEGIGTFYRGEIGKRIVARLDALHGFVTLDDLRRNEPTWVTPISVPFRGYRVWELPPNSQGIAALEMLRILEPIDLLSHPPQRRPA